jgi:competence protein ComEC
VQSGRRCPAFIAACALALGVLASSLMHAMPVFGPAAAGLLLLAASAAVSCPLRPGRRGGVNGGSPGLADVCLLVAVALGGAVSYASRHVMVDPRDACTLAGAGRLSLEAAVVDVRAAADGRCNLVVRPLSRSSSSGEAESLQGVEANAGGIAGLVWASLPPRSTVIPTRGDVVRLSGELALPRGPRNPGAFDFARYLIHRDIRSVMRVSEMRIVHRTRGPAAVASWISETVRRRVPGTSGDVVRALLLGGTRGLPEELTNAFRRSGTVHVLAVSGLHVGFVVLIVYTLLRCVRVPPRAARIAVVPFLVAFVAVVGPKASVLRAGAMATVLIAASTLGRKTNLLNTLGVSGFLLVAARPGALFDLGFRLSFAAVLGIALAFEPLRRHLGRAAGRKRAFRLATDAAALSLSAQLGVAPVLVAVGGELALAAPLVNPLVVPLAASAVASGMALLAAEALVPAAAPLLGASTWLCVRLMSALVETVGGLTWASLPVASRQWPAILGLVAAVSVCLRGRTRRVKASGLVGLLAAAGLAAALALAGPGRTSTRVTFFDVGQGDAALIECANGRTILVDTGRGPLPGAGGGPRTADSGRDVILPYLRREGVRRLDLLVITHAHADHVGGAGTVLAGVSVGRLVVPPGLDDMEQLRGVLDVARQRGTRVQDVVAGDTVACGPSTLLVLAPGRDFDRRDTTENDMSVVTLLRLAGFGFLLTGDAEERSERAVCRLQSDITTDVLKVGHHGSATSTGGGFLARASPRLSVISVGAGNRHGHPDPATLERLASAGSHVLRTDLDGAVVLILGDGALVARAVASGREAVLRDDRPQSPNRGNSASRGPTATSE